MRAAKRSLSLTVKHSLIAEDVANIVISHESSCAGRLKAVELLRAVETWACGITTRQQEQLERWEAAGFEALVARRY